MGLPHLRLAKTNKINVILNGVKNPTEELTGRYFSLGLWDISLALNMTYFFRFLLRGKWIASVAKQDDRG